MSDDFDIRTVFALELGIPLKRRKVELRRPQDIPVTYPNRKERRQMDREMKRRPQ